MKIKAAVISPPCDSEIENAGEGSASNRLLGVLHHTLYVELIPSGVCPLPVQAKSFPSVLVPIATKAFFPGPIAQR